MKITLTWIWFTVLRLLLFAIPLGVLLLVGIDVWISTAVAAAFGLSASLVFLRRQRETMANGLYIARHRGDPRRIDEEHEDSAVGPVSD